MSNTTVQAPLELFFYDINADGDELHLFALDDNGEFFTVHVTHAPYYFFIDAPSHFTQSQCDTFCSYINNCIARTAPRKRKRTYQSQQIDSDYTEEEAPPEIVVASVTVVMAKTIWGYQPRPRPFLRLTLSNPRFRYAVKELAERGIAWGPFANLHVATYEASMKPTERYMQDKNIVGMGWMSIARYSDAPYAISTCNREIVVHADNISALSSMRLPPYRILSFDIECAGRKGIFPTPDIDPVIQIGNHCVLRGAREQSLDATVFVLNGCSNVVGANVRSFAHEDQLLGAWAAYVHAMDPLFLTGYNIVAFDLPYLLERAIVIAKKWNAAAAGRPCACADLAFLGKYRVGASEWSRRRATTVARDKFSSSNQAGARESKSIKPLWGRLLFDMIEVIQKDYKLNSYSLNNVAQTFLKDQKEDLHHSLITPLHHGSDADRARIAIYCLKDALLPIRLMDKLMSMVNYIEMARVTGVPFSYLLTRGVGIKVLTKIYSYTVGSSCAILIPDHRSGDPFDLVGALVLTPRKGFYDMPIIVLDFASLYPSIMMAHNLCYSAAVLPGQTLASLELREEDVFTTAAGHTFVRKDKYMGVLPKVLYDLVGQRAKAKDDLKLEKDPMRKAVLDGRQLALKIVCNSVYGFTGAQDGFPMLAVSESVTKTGQEMNRLTQRLVLAYLREHIFADTEEARAYRQEFGIVYDEQAVQRAMLLSDEKAPNEQSPRELALNEAFGIDIIYGDTDSVMAKAGFPSISIKETERRTFIMTEAMRIGSALAKHVTAHFTPPIKLEFEKIYFPYLLLSKKKYAGLYWTDPKQPRQPNPMDVKGIESARRDWCALVKFVVERSLDLMLIQQDVPTAIAFVKSVITDLLTNRVDIALLVLSKQLSNDYKTKQPHAELAERMRARDPGSAPHVGDRVAYVIVQGGMRDKVCDKAEDPIYAMENNLVIDAGYYVERQLSGPVRRIFKPLVPSTDDIFTGEHTRHVVRPTPEKSKHNIMAFAVRRNTCLGCGVSIADNELHCGRCADRAVAIYAESVASMNALQAEFATLWTNCQRCQGSFFNDVLCTSRDCAVYYKRTRVRKDLEAAAAKVQRQREASKLEW